MYICRFDVVLDHEGVFDDVGDAFPCDGSAWYFEIERVCVGRELFVSEGSVGCFAGLKVFKVFGFFDHDGGTGLCLCVFGKVQDSVKIVDDYLGFLLVVVADVAAEEHQ